MKKGKQAAAVIKMSPAELPTNSQGKKRLLYRESSSRSKLTKQREGRSTQLVREDQSSE